MRGLRNVVVFEDVSREGTRFRVGYVGYGIVGVILILDCLAWLCDWMEK